MQREVIHPMKSTGIKGGFLRIGRGGGNLHAIDL